MEYDSAIKKKNEILLSAITWMALRNCAECNSQTEKDKRQIISVICRNKNQTSRSVTNSDTENVWMVGKWEGFKGNG